MLHLRRWLIHFSVIVGVLTYSILDFSVHGARWLSPIAMRITTRILGLLLAAVAIQFIVTALVMLQVIPCSIGSASSVTRGSTAKTGEGESTPS